MIGEIKFVPNTFFCGESLFKRLQSRFSKDSDPSSFQWSGINFKKDDYLHPDTITTNDPKLVDIMEQVESEFQLINGNNND